MKLLNNLAGLRIISGAIFSVRKYINPISEAKYNGDVAGEKELIVTAAKAWSNKVLKALDIEINVINPENFPQDGPVVYVANHQSYADIFTFLHAVPHQVGFIAKSELNKIPGFNQWIERIRSVFIKRDDVRSSLNTINEGAELVKKGFSLVIFPEGTRSGHHEMAHFKPGALKLATKAQAVVIPVTLEGGYRTFEEKGEIVKGAHIDMVVHEPIDTSILSRQELAELSNRVENTIREGLKMFE